MGSPVTPQTALGRRARPLRNKLARLLKAVADNPPEGVRIPSAGRHGVGGHYVTPEGYAGISLYEFALSHHSLGFQWRDHHIAQQALRRFMDGGHFRHKQLDVIEAWLPVFAIEIKDAGVTDAVSALDVVEAERHLSAVPEPGLDVIESNASPVITVTHSTVEGEIVTGADAILTSGSNPHVAELQAAAGIIDILGAFDRRGKIRVMNVVSAYLESSNG